MWLALLVVVSLAGTQEAPPRDLPQPKTGTAIIRGSVVDRETSAPLRDCIVRLVGGERPLESRTDRNGRYQFTQLPAGKYSLMVDSPEFRPTYLPQSFGDTQPFDPGRPQKRRLLELRDGEIRANVNFALWRSLAIEGRVTDEYGEPMAHIEVHTERPGDRNSSFSRGSSRSTDDRGAFRLFGLPPGEYLVCARPPNYGRMSEDVHDRPVRTCHPSAVINSDARTVRLTTADVEDIEIRVQRSRAFTVSGIVLDASGSPAERANLGLVTIDRNNMSSSSIESQPGGGFVARGVTPGEYVIRAEIGPEMGPNDTREPQIGVLPVRVEAADVEGLVVVLVKPAKIAGHVAFEEGTPMGRRTSPMTIATRFDPPASTFMSGPLPAAKVKDDLTFELSGLVGRQTLVVTGVPPGWMLKAIRYNDADITDQPTEFKSAADPRGLEVVLSSRGAILSGRTVDVQGNPIGGARVIMFAVNPDRWRVVATTTAVGTSRDDGTFRFPPRRSGDYLVVAIDPEEVVPPLQESSTFELLAKVAEKVTLIENDQRVMDLRVVKLPE